MNTGSSGGSRLAFIDALKAVASQLIVLHHLAFYGPMSDYAQPLAPELITWLSQHARIAVQIFLVLGGFLAAQTLTPNGIFVERPVVTLLRRRYTKLVLPYLGALLLSIACAAIARCLSVNHVIPNAPTLPQFLAHLLLLQSILGFDGLSAGVWYIAIDFQLYTLLVFILWIARRVGPTPSTLASLLVVVLIVVSLFYFNRDESWDNWAPYFFGAYGLGVITYWTVKRHQTPIMLVLVFLAAVVAMLVDYRSRIVVALLVATALTIAYYAGFIENWPKSKIFAWLGKISYAVFLVHFPLFLVINALFERFVPHEPAIQFLGILLAWIMSIGGGAIFHHQIESRVHRVLRGKSQA